MNRRDLFKLFAGAVAAPAVAKIAAPELVAGGYVPRDMLAILDTTHYVPIAQVRSISGPEYPKIIDLTTYGQSQEWRRRLATLVDAKDISFECHFEPNSDLKCFT